MRLKLSLQQYNQFVWAVLGTVALGLLLCAAWAAAWHWHGYRAYGAMRIEAVEGASVRNISGDVSAHAAMPVQVADSPYELIPVSVDRLVVSGKFFKVKRDWRGNRPYWGRHWGQPWHGAWHHGWHEGWGGEAGCDLPLAGNVLIRDTRNGATHLLLPQPAVIYAMAYPGAHGAGGQAGDAFPPNGTLYWEIGLADSNGDGELNKKDDVGAYLSDADGSHLVRVTPPGSHVVARAYDAARKVLTLKIETDTNGDKSLDHNDKTSLIEVSVPQRKMLGVIFDDASGQQGMSTLTPLNQLPVAQ